MNDRKFDCRFPEVLLLRKDHEVSFASDIYVQKFGIECICQQRNKGSFKGG